MKFAKRLLMVAGAVALAGFFSVMLAPKAVHAVVSSLVTVSNTGANPVPTADVHQSAAQSVTLSCTSTYTSCFSLSPTGGTGAAYTVPTGQTLMVTDVEISTPGGGGTAIFSIQPTLTGCMPICGNQYWYVSNDGYTHQFVMPSGIPFPAGDQLMPLGTVTVVAFLRGYLTSN
jgi:hypothetical protein